MCPSLIQIGSKTAEKNSAQTNKQTNKQTDRHYENNGHLAVKQKCNLHTTVKVVNDSTQIISRYIISNVRRHMSNATYRPMERLTRRRKSEDV